MDDIKTVVMTAGMTSALVTGFGKVIAEDLWKGFKAIVLSPFQNPKVAEEAERRATATLDKVAQRLHDLEQASAMDRTILNRALEDPGFALMLQSALIHSAETSDEAKHDLLARLITARLLADAETPQAMVIPLACTAIPRLRAPNFAELAIHAVFRFGVPSFSDAAKTSEPQFLLECDNRFSTLLQPFDRTIIAAHDLTHLESAGCGSMLMAQMADSREGVSKWKTETNYLTMAKLRAMPFFGRMKPTWTGVFTMFRPNTCGEIIGLATLEATGADIGLPSWHDWMQKTSDTSGA